MVWCAVPPSPLVVDKTVDDATRIATIVVVSLMCVGIFMYLIFRTFRQWMDEEERQVDEIHQVRKNCLFGVPVKRSVHAH